MKDKTYRLWAGDDESCVGLRCLFIPKCEFCGTSMIVWCCKPIKFKINDGGDTPNSHAVDVEMWCPECGYWEAFGVAVSKEHYEDVSGFIREHPKKTYYRIKDESEI
jgi:hypothetical protein